MLPCYVGYEMELEDFLHMFHLTIEEAANRARARGLIRDNDYYRDSDCHCAERYMKHMLKESGTKIRDVSVDKGAIVFGIPLDKKISVCPFGGGAPIAQLLSAIEDAKSQFFDELRKIGDPDLSAVRLTAVESPFEPAECPEPRFIGGWNP